MFDQSFGHVTVIMMIMQEFALCDLGNGKRRPNDGFVPESVTVES